MFFYICKIFLAFLINFKSVKKETKTSLKTWYGDAATKKRKRATCKQLALIANSGPAAGVNIVVGYKQNWIDIINSALNETWKWNVHTLIWEDLLRKIQTWIRFQSYITPLAAGYSYFAHIQIWIRFQSYIPQNWKLDIQGVPCLS